jgi:methionyl-tRNA formyltransferase
MKIAFFGLPLAALLLLEDRHEIVFAAICRRGALGSRRLRARLGDRHVAVVPDVTTDAFAERLARDTPDLIVSWFWTTKLPMRVVRAARLGAFGVHPSLLPRHRGPDPYFWAIESGDEETGVTAHRIEAEYDTGAILGRRSIAINPAWNAWTLAKKLDRPSLALLRETARAFASGTPPAEEPQDEALATRAPSPEDGLFEIMWAQPTAAVVRRVRASSPWPGAFTDLGGEELTLTQVAPVSDFPKVLAPGECAVVGGKAVVRTGDGAVALLEGRDPDDLVLNERELAARVGGMAKALAVS